jgi:hypothetical protein
MPRYLAESYLGRRADLAALVRRADAAARALGVRHVRTSFMREDELCLQWFEAPSGAVVADIGRRAGIDFDRIVEAVEITDRPEESWSNAVRR